MRVEVAHPDSDGTRKRLKEQVQKKILTDLLGGRTLEEVLISLLEKDAFPNQVPPGVGIPGDQIRAAKKAMRELSSAVYSGVTLTELSKKSDDFIRTKENLVAEMKKKEEAELTAVDDADKDKDKP